MAVRNDLWFDPSLCFIGGTAADKVHGETSRFKSRLAETAVSPGMHYP